MYLKEWRGKASPGKRRLQRGPWSRLMERTGGRSGAAPGRELDTGRGRECPLGWKETPREVVQCLLSADLDTTEHGLSL